MNINGIQNQNPNSIILKRQGTPFTAFVPTKYANIKKEQINDSFEKINNKISQASDSKLSQAILLALSPIPQIRKVSSAPDDIKDGNFIRAIGMLAYTAMFFPEDSRDVWDGIKQLMGKGKAPISPNHQHKFSYFRGTLAEPLLKMQGKNSQKVSQFLYKADKTIYDTKLGKFLEKTFDFKVSNSVATGKLDALGNKILSFEVKGSKFGKVIGKSLLRMTKLSFLTLGVLELPAIIKAFLNSKNEDNSVVSGSKQIVKSSVKVTSILSGIGLAGAALAKKGPVGSLVGMGLGAFAGSKFSKLISSFIDGGSKKVESVDKDLTNSKKPLNA